MHGRDRFEGVVDRGVVDFGVVDVFGVPDFEVLPDLCDFWTGVVDLDSGFEPEFDLDFEFPELEFAKFIFDANFSAVA